MTTQPTFEGEPCARCNSTTRFARGSKQCVRCKADARARWREQNPETNEAKAARARRYRAAKQAAVYGLKLADVAAMRATQADACAICRKPFGDEKPQIDHCHLTETVRGLLCGKCNRALGQFNDDPLLISRALAYLTR